MQSSDDLAYTPEAFLAGVLKEHRKKGCTGDSAPSEEYIYKYFRGMRIADFAAFPLEEASILALDLWEFALAAGEERKIRIRPAPGESGKALGLDIIEMVGKDLSFLVDSTISACLSQGAEIRAIVHPAVEIAGQDRSLVQLPITALPRPAQKRLLTCLQQALMDVELVNVDFVPMRDKMLGAAAWIRTLQPRKGLEIDEIAEAADFLDWLGRHHFTFLGARDYNFPLEAKDSFTPGIVKGSGLGILRDKSRHELTSSQQELPALITPKIHTFLSEPHPVIVAKSNMRSQVHRYGTYADYIGVKRHDSRGRVTGETRFVGLFTSEAYNKEVSDVPLIRRKADRIKKLHGAGGSRHSERVLHDVLENFPRDEFFQGSEEDLLRISKGILELQQRPRARLFIRRDRFDRYVSALTFTPRDRYSGQIQQRIHQALAEAYNGRTSAAYPSFSDRHLVRVHFVIGLNADFLEPDETALEQKICQLGEPWEDALIRTARRSGMKISRDEAGAFSAAYAEKFGAEGAVEDLRAIGGMGRDSFLVRAYSRSGRKNDAYCKIYHRGSAIDLSEIVPVLENMGLKVRAESQYRLALQASASRPVPIWVHDIEMAIPEGQHLPDTFAQAFTAVWTGQTENDGFNQLIVRLGVSWREAALLRTLCRYRQQTGLDSSQRVQIKALTTHENITRLILRLFSVRLDPDNKLSLVQRGSESAELVKQIEQALDEVSSLDDDRILRRLSMLVSAILRTNFYQGSKRGGIPAHIAIKIASQELDALPAPRPYREIFVWSPSVEGVHLRFGSVARGGLRWSDRRDDFRTEVLGLVKAQQVKNAVIVPVGSKGGFFPKALPSSGSREQIMEAGQAAYKTFISALIDLTDNIESGKVKPPSRCVIWDGEDPYLVVAADKGTATFSDIANEIAIGRGFWLGDAFASGGSAGYDHKKMGITARGAWEAIKRHFREAGKDIQSEPFTVIGVGDMSGDVFGNGMLLSEQTRLLGAFNHLHIFMDPDPDPASAFTERKRLFDLPRSGWGDYDTELISQGGGVFERSAKSIPLSKQIQELTGLTESAVAPDTLIAALLRAETELLWFGGVGTYIKARHEHNPDVGDKTNDVLRIDACEAKAKIIGEGANLGVTQAGRIEFALSGGRINTDAVDNSAGVDCSDHEVNIKILLSGAIEAGELQEKKRNDLLAGMTDEVAALVLKNNYDQTGALTRMQMESSARIDAHEQLMMRMEGRGVLDRGVEGLPSAEELNERRQAGRGLTRPELSVLMAYAKIDMFNELAESDAPDDPAFEALLCSYFPPALSGMKRSLSTHRLRREIIATLLANRLVNVAGAVFPYQLADAQGIDAGRLTCALEAAHCIFDADRLFSRIEALDNVISVETQTRMYNDVSDALCRAGVYLCIHAKSGVGRQIESYHAAIGKVRKDARVILSSFESRRLDKHVACYEERGVPVDVAQDAACIQALVVALEAVDIAATAQWPVESAARIHASIGQLLGMDQIRAAIQDLSITGHWENLALQQMARECPSQIKCLSLAVIGCASKLGVIPEKLNEDSALITADSWLNQHQELADRLMLPFLKPGNAWSLAKLVLALGSLRNFVRQTAGS